MKRLLLAALVGLMLGCSAVRTEFGLGSDEKDYTNGYLALLLGAATASGCPDAQRLSGTLTNNLRTASCVLLTGTVFVPSGFTLTIPAGARIFAESGAALFVLPGGKIIANGTQTNPIVFSSSQAEGTRAPGDWGGLVLIGNAPTNQAAKNSEGAFPQVYGGPSSNNSADSSGSLSYVRIEYAGYPVTAGNELNCLSLYAVGSGTNLDHIQCHMGKDDSFEFFGGRVNAKYLLSTGAADDDFDIDEGYVGKWQFIIAVRYGGNAGSGSTDPRGFEWNGTCNAPCVNDGSGASTQYSTLDVANMTLIGPGAAPYAGNGAAPAGPFGRARVRMIANMSHMSGSAWGTGSNGAWQTVDAGTVLTVANIYGDTSSALSAGTGTINGSISGTPYNGTTVLPVTLSWSPIGSFAGPTSETGIDLRPSAAVPAAANLNTVSGFSDSFFTNNTTPGGMLASDNWTSGWARFSIL